MLFLLKAKGGGIRMVHAIQFLPDRMKRLLAHLANGLTRKKEHLHPELPIGKGKQWLIESMVLLLDIFAVPEIYETLMDFGKWRTRPLTSDEIALARSVFGDSILYNRVRVDETATIICRRHNIYYVSFFTINSWGKFRPEIFIHEMMHVWQFQHLGSVYIPRALLAQQTLKGYDYGGTEVLLQAIAEDSGFAPFNFEQQADIVADYFCLREGLMPSWCRPYESNFLPLYQYFINKLLEKNSHIG